MQRKNFDHSIDVPNERDRTSAGNKEAMDKLFNSPLNFIFNLQRKQLRQCRYDPKTKIYSSLLPVHSKPTAWLSNKPSKPFKQSINKRERNKAKHVIVNNNNNNINKSSKKDLCDNNDQLRL
jgi:hypothetical protein